MKKLLIFSIILIIHTTYSQTQQQENNIKSWFNNYGICKCITQAYWLKGIKIEDSSILFWNNETPISSNNVENFEENINTYIQKNIPDRSDMCKLYQRQDSAEMLSVPASNGKALA